MPHTFLLINGSRTGVTGNTATLMNYTATYLRKYGNVEHLNLTEEISTSVVEQSLRTASAFVIGTGTYWDSWGSLLQRFLEDMTHTEGTDCWFGKPVAVIVTMHSVGGKGVLSRLQGVMNTFGAIIPPMAGLIYSAVAQIALEGGENSITEDLWRPSDIDVICHNLVECCNGTNEWAQWPVEKKHFTDRWIDK